MSVLGMMFSVIVSAGDAPVQFENCEIDDRYMICDITNGYDTSIREIRFDVIMRDENRAVPWVEAEGKRRSGPGQIRGGIEPGETVRELMLVPSIPPRAKLDTLLIELFDFDITGPDGQALN